MLDKACVDSSFCRSASLGRLVKFRIGAKVYELSLEFNSGAPFFAVSIVVNPAAAAGVCRYELVAGNSAYLRSIAIAASLSHFFDGVFFRAVGTHTDICVFQRVGSLVSNVTAVAFAFPEGNASFTAGGAPVRGAYYRKPAETFS